MIKKIATLLCPPNSQSSLPIHDFSKSTDIESLSIKLKLDNRPANIENFTTTIKSSPYSEGFFYIYLSSYKESDNENVTDKLTNEKRAVKKLRALLDAVSESDKAHFIVLVDFALFFNDDFEANTILPSDLPVESVLQRFDSRLSEHYVDPYINSEFTLLAKTTKKDLYKVIWYGLGKRYQDGFADILSNRYTDKSIKELLIKIGMLKKEDYYDIGKQSFDPEFVKYVYQNTGWRQFGLLSWVGETWGRCRNKIIGIIQVLLFLLFLGVLVYRFNTTWENPHKLYLELRLVYVFLALYWSSTVGVKLILQKRVPFLGEWIRNDYLLIIALIGTVLGFIILIMYFPRLSLISTLLSFSFLIMAIIYQIETVAKNISGQSRTFSYWALLLLSFFFTYLPSYFYLNNNIENELTSVSLVRYSTWTSRGDTVEYIIESQAENPTSFEVRLPDPLEFGDSDSLLNQDQCRLGEINKSGNSSVRILEIPNLDNSNPTVLCTFTAFLPFAAGREESSKLNSNYNITVKPITTEPATATESNLDILPLEIGLFRMLPSTLLYHSVFSNMRVWLLQFSVFWITVVCEVALASTLQRVIDRS